MSKNNIPDPMCHFWTTVSEARFKRDNFFHEGFGQKLYENASKNLMDARNRISCLEFGTLSRSDFFHLHNTQSKRRKQWGLKCPLKIDFKLTGWSEDA